MKKINALTLKGSIDRLDARIDRAIETVTESINITAQQEVNMRTLIANNNDRHTEAIDDIDTRLDRLDDRVARVAIRLDSVDQELVSNAGAIDELMDAQPIDFTVDEDEDLPNDDGDEVYDDGTSPPTEEYWQSMYRKADMERAYWQARAEFYRNLLDNDQIL